MEGGDGWVLKVYTPDRCGARAGGAVEIGTGGVGDVGGDGGEAGDGSAGGEGGLKYRVRRCRTGGHARNAAEMGGEGADGDGVPVHEVDCVVGGGVLGGVGGELGDVFCDGLVEGEVADAGKEGIDC